MKSLGECPNDLQKILVKQNEFFKQFMQTQGTVWLMPGILVSWEEEIRRITVPGQSRQIVNHISANKES
jgi:hypothetical protein